MIPPSKMTKMKEMKELSDLDLFLIMVYPKNGDEGPISGSLELLYDLHCLFCVNGKSCAYDYTIISGIL